MSGASTAAGRAPLTKRSRRGLRGQATPLVVVGVAMAMVVLAVARLDPVYDEVPGVFRSSQLLPLPLELRYELAGVRRDFDDKTTAEQELDQRTTQRAASDVAAVQDALSALSDDVAVRSWQEGARSV